MRKYLNLKTKKAQTAVEYMMLLAAVAVIVLIGFKDYLPRFHDSSNVFFGRVTTGIYGEPSRCGDGACTRPFENCCQCEQDCGFCPPNPDC